MVTKYPELGWTVDDWREAFVSGRVGVDEFEGWTFGLSANDPAWIYLAPWDEISAQVRALVERLGRDKGAASSLPLCGVPFAVKDNIDVAGWPTTAACPAFRYVAERDASVVELLRKAGAIVVGKTNMDQFATGLVGTRSPYGIVRSAFNEEYIAGGSSSGSASLVTHGILPFTLGTDTAGSGRVPAALGNIVGVKPTRGVFSASGVVPACRTLDCVSIFAHTVADASLITRLLMRFDSADPYSREFPESSRAALPENPRVGVFDSLEFFADLVAETAYRESLERLQQDGFELLPVSSQPFFELAQLLYAGPWVAERSLTAGTLLDGAPEDMDPVVREILRPAREFRAEDAFRYEYRRAELAARIQASFLGLDAIVVPTTGTTYKVEEVEREPILTNARLGMYTNFTNLSDLCGVAIPARFRTDGLPTGLTLLGPAFADFRLLLLAERAHRRMDVPLGATERPLPGSQATADTASPDPGLVKVAVVGAHLSGMPLNFQLTSRGARLVSKTKTSERYRLFLLPGTEPQKPGLKRDEEGLSIALEVWELSVAEFGAFAAEVPPPLGIGSLELVDGSWVKGFICEPCAFKEAKDISVYGGFRAYVEATSR